MLIRAELLSGIITLSREEDIPIRGPKIFDPSSGLNGRSISGYLSKNLTTSPPWVSIQFIYPSSCPIRLQNKLPPFTSTTLRTQVVSLKETDRVYFLGASAKIKSRS